MSLFVDGLLLQLSDSAQLSQLLAPAGDTNHTRLRTLLNTMYDLQYATIHSVQDMKVKVESQRLLLTTHQTRGVWRQTSPNHLHTDIMYEGSDRLEPIWLDISVEAKLTLLMEVDRGEVQSVNAHQLVPLITDERSIDKRSREHAMDVMIQMKQPVPFDPQDPANTQIYTLNLAVFIRDTLDVAATLRSVKLAGAIMERVTAYQKQLDSVEVLTPYAPIVIFPQSALQGTPFTQNALQTFFAQEGVLALFMTFP